MLHGEHGAVLDGHLAVLQCRKFQHLPGSFFHGGAQEVGANLTDGYNGHTTTREAGSVGGQNGQERLSRTNLKFQS